MNKRLATGLACIFALIFVSSISTESSPDHLYWIKIKATDKFERSAISNTGASILHVADDHVVATGNREELKSLEELGSVEVSFPLDVDGLDYPHEDQIYHNYEELTEAIQALAAHSEIVEIGSIGQSVEGREIPVIRISTSLDTSHTKPAAIFMGGHHAREHLSVEVPLKLAQYLVNEYNSGNARIVRLIESREVHIIPIVNPDGAEHDISDGQYKTWRKNRAHNDDGTYGVDLNRNYSHMWGTGGASSSPHSDTYRGPKPFSEPETQAVKAYIEAHENISTLLTFHTFSELILYPWGHTYDRVSEERDHRVYEAMAQKMAKWNGYRPQQTSELYKASGDTTDWAYGTLGIFSFTFELDPRWAWGSGGFYPGPDKIQTAFNKNIEPCLYLIEYSDSPYRALEESEAHPYSAVF